MHNNVEEAIQMMQKDGWTKLTSVVDMPRVNKLLAMCNEWFEKTADQLTEEVPYLNRNQPCLYNIQNKDFYFLELLFDFPILHEVLMPLLNDKWFKQIPQSEPNYILRSFGARSSNYGMPLHIDSFIPYLGDYPVAVQCAFILEDQTPENGCTIIVPGSHKSGEYASQDARDRAIPIHSKAGDIVMWDTRAWHATTDNVSGGTRWAILSTFSRWWIKQQFNVTDNLPQEIYERLTDNQKAILGYCSIPHNNEFEGIDLKRGYENLAKDVSTYRH